MQGLDAHSGPGGVLSRIGPLRHGGGAAVTGAGLAYLVRLHSFLAIGAILAAPRHDGDRSATSVPTVGGSGNACSVNRSVNETRRNRPRWGRCAASRPISAIVSAEVS